MNKPTLIITGLSIIVALGIGYFLGHSQPSLAEMTNTNSNPAQQINLQAQCANQAQKTLETFTSQYTSDGWDPGTAEPASTRTNFTQTNHYNQQLNKCFVLIKYDFTYAGTLNEHFISSGETFFDAFQNDELASCVHSHRLSYGNFPEKYTDTCLIGQGNGLTSLQNYNDFVSQRMESTQ